jgi:hypothetical protein
MREIFGKILLTKREYEALLEGQKKPILYMPKRVCCECNKQIVKHHKFYYGEDSKVRHRCCERPESYGDQIPGTIKESLAI